MFFESFSYLYFVYAFWYHIQRVIILGFINVNIDIKGQS